MNNEQKIKKLSEEVQILMHVIDTNQRTIGNMLTRIEYLEEKQNKKHKKKEKQKEKENSKVMYG